MVIQESHRWSDNPVRIGSELPGSYARMTTIRTTCPLCGDVELAPADLSLRLAPCRGTGSYRFRCPHCEEWRQRPAGHRVVSILLATGVPYEVVGDQEPITEREIRRFMADLDRGNWQEHLIP